MAVARSGATDHVGEPVSAHSVGVDLNRDRFLGRDVASTGVSRRLERNAVERGLQSFNHESGSIGA
jgi:hypothetical protein